MKVLECRKVGEDVSKDMLEMAASLRRLAAKVESGDTVAVSVAWVTAECEVGSVSTFDEYGHTLLGATSKTQTRLAMRLIDDEPLS